MDWTQTLTIILTIGASTAAVWYVVKEDIKLAREGIKTEIGLIREDIKRHDVELMDIRHEMKDIRHEMKEEFSKVHALWADLLKQIYEVKLDQAKKA